MDDLEYALNFNDEQRLCLICPGECSECAPIDPSGYMNSTLDQRETEHACGKMRMTERLAKQGIVKEWKDHPVLMDLQSTRGFDPYVGVFPCV